MNRSIQSSNYRKLLLQDKYLNICINDNVYLHQHLKASELKRFNPNDILYGVNSLKLGDLTCQITNMLLWLRLIDEKTL